MGLLVVGQPLDWDDSVALLDKVRRFGVLQFISAYERCKDYSGDVLLWGDEIEYAIVKLDAAVSVCLYGGSGA
jgi:glutamate--cysteine ligase catalytic subunit